MQPAPDLKDDLGNNPRSTNRLLAKLITELRAAERNRAERDNAVLIMLEKAHDQHDRTNKELEQLRNETKAKLAEITAPKFDPAAERIDLGRLAREARARQGRRGKKEHR